MTYKSPFGARAGLADRLDDWAERLAVDKKLPWAGCGLLADLKTAADVLNGVPEKPQTKMDFDL